MALVTYSTMFSQICGRIGSTIYSAGRFGPSIRIKYAKFRIPTGAFLQNQVWLSYLANLWRANFSYSLYLAWKSFASLHPYRRKCGSISTDTPYGSFQRINLRRLKAGNPTTIWPP